MSRNGGCQLPTRLLVTEFFSPSVFGSWVFGGGTFKSRRFKPSCMKQEESRRSNLAQQTLGLHS